MTLNISSVFTYDEDAGNYIQAVEAADEADTPGIGALEPATRQAINNFVVGCKQDGIWDAIKASCILAGARTTNGALIPLKGTAPMPYNFDLVGDTDYDRKTGLKGNASNKYLDTNVKPSDGLQDNAHFSTYVTSTSTVANRDYIGAVVTTPSVTSSQILDNNGSINFSINMSAGAQQPFSTGNAFTGFFGARRSSSLSVNYRYNASTVTASVSSVAPANVNFIVFGRNLNGSPDRLSDRAHTFYSIGESLDLAKLDARVTDLITAFGAAIP